MSVTRRQNSGDVLQLDSGSELNVEAGATIRVSGIVEVVNSGKILLTNTFWEDLRFPASGINPPGPTAAPTRDETDGRLHFSASATNSIAIQVQMPHGWKEGSSIGLHAHWSPSSSHTGDVKWEAKYKIANINEAFPADWTTVTVMQAGSGTADMHQIKDLANIEMTGKTFSCMLLILISRLGADAADTFTGTAALNEVDIHYEIDGFGTNEEYTK